MLVIRIISIEDEEKGKKKFLGSKQKRPFASSLALTSEKSLSTYKNKDQALIEDNSEDEEEQDFTSALEEYNRLKVQNQRNSRKKLFSQNFFPCDLQKEILCNGKNESTDSDESIDVTYLKSPARSQNNDVAGYMKRKE